MRRTYLSSFILVAALLASVVVYGATTPKEAVGFFGQVTGTVKSAQADGRFFSLIVSKAEPTSQSMVKDPAAIVGKIITLGTRMPRQPDGTPMPHVQDVAYIKSLKVGDVITIKVFAVHGAPNVLRMLAPGQPATTRPATSQPGKQGGD